MISAVTPRLDVIIPVYNEGANILPALQSLMRAVKTPLRVLICYDREDDNTLTAIRNSDTLGGPPDRVCTEPGARRRLSS